MKERAYQRLNNLGITLLEQGKFGEARKYFVSSLEALKKSPQLQALRAGCHHELRSKSMKRSLSQDLVWCNGTEELITRNDSLSYIWARGLLIQSTAASENLSKSEMGALVATITFNTAICLHLMNRAVVTQGTPKSLKCTERVYKLVLKLLQKTDDVHLVARIKVAVYNNIASLHCQTLDCRESYRWYALLAQLLREQDSGCDEMVTLDGGGIVANLMFCCRPIAAGAA